MKSKKDAMEEETKKTKEINKMKTIRGELLIFRK